MSKVQVPYLSRCIIKLTTIRFRFEGILCDSILPQVKIHIMSNCLKSLGKMHRIIIALVFISNLIFFFFVVNRTFSRSWNYKNYLSCLFNPLLYQFLLGATNFLSFLYFLFFFFLPYGVQQKAEISFGILHWRERTVLWNQFTTRQVSASWFIEVLITSPFERTLIAWCFIFTNAYLVGPH